jgi:hypothetical protein
MRKLIRFFGKLIASILVLVFIASTLLSILLLSINTQLFNQDFYQEVFNEVDFFDQLPKLAANQIRHAMVYNPCREDPSKCEGDGPPEESEETDQGGPPSYFQALSEEDWELLIEGLLPPDWLEEQVLNVLEGIFDSIDQGYGTLSITISLRELKDRLVGEAGVEAIAQVLEAQPECSKDDLLDMTRILQGDEEVGGNFLNCHPPDDFIEDFTPQIEVLLRRSLPDMPDQIDLGESLLGGEGSDEPTLELFDREIPTLALVKWVRWIINISPLLCLILLMVIAFFGVYSYKALGRWWGYPLAISGLMGLGISMLVGPAADFFTNSYLKKRDFAGFSPEMVETGSDLALEVIHRLFLQVRTYSLIVIGMGFAVIITAAIIRSPKKKTKLDEEEIPPAYDGKETQEEVGESIEDVDLSSDEESTETEEEPAEDPPLEDSEETNEDQGDLDQDTAEN